MKKNTNQKLDAALRAYTYAVTVSELARKARDAARLYEAGFVSRAFALRAMARFQAA